MYLSRTLLKNCKLEKVIIENLCYLLNSVFEMSAIPELVYFEDL